ERHALGHGEIRVRELHRAEGLGGRLIDGGGEARGVARPRMRMSREDPRERVALYIDIEDVEPVAAQECERARPRELVPKILERERSVALAAAPENVDHLAEGPDG